MPSSSNPIDFGALLAALQTRNDAPLSEENTNAVHALYGEVRSFIMRHRKAAWNEHDIEEIVSESIKRTLELVFDGEEITDLLLTAKKEARNAMSEHKTGFGYIYRPKPAADGSRPRINVHYAEIDHDEAETNYDLQMALGRAAFMQPEKELLYAEVFEAWRKSFFKLKQKEQEVILLHGYYEVPHEQIAERLDLKTANNSSRKKQRGLEKWRNHFDNDYDNR